MASIVQRGKRYRALVRRGGHSRCETFSSLKAARDWAKTVEDQVEQLRSTGKIQPKGLTVGDVIDWYVRQIGPFKRWGRTKSSSLAKLKAEFGNIAVSDLTSAHIVDAFTRRAHGGCGPATLSCDLSYLSAVLKAARAVQKLDVPVGAVTEARSALSHVGLVGKSRERDRRPSPAELERIMAYFRTHHPSAPFCDIIEFCIASAMRISEVCRIRWSDLDEATKCILVRDRKNPRERIGNHGMVPLLNIGGLDAFAIVMRQPSDRAGRIFPFAAKNISDIFSRSMIRLGIDLHLHDLRHEGLSRLAEAGYSLAELRVVSGHRSFDMLARYVNLKARNLHRAPTPAPAAAPMLSVVPKAASA